MGFKTSIFRHLTRTTTISAGLFAGGALYVQFVEHPSRRALETKGMYLQWKASMSHGRIMPVFLLVSSLSGIGAYVLKQKAKGIPWLLAGGALAVLLPYTSLVMFPFATAPIHSQERAERKGDEYTRKYLEKWYSLHTLRTVVSVAVFGGCVYALTLKF